jgi:uncharacterized OB-fold protein
MTPNDSKGIDMNGDPEEFAPPGSTVIAADDFRTDGTHAVLRITRCQQCSSAWFPAREQCSNCASRDVVPELTSSTGIAYASTIVRVGPKQFQAPYGLAYVDVDGVRVLVHVNTESALPPATPVDLVFASIGADESGTLLSYSAVPTSSGGLQ